MDTVRAVRNYYRREWTVRDVVNGQERPFIRRILKKVYLSLAFALFSSALGSFLHTNGNIGSLFVATGAFTTVICFHFVSPWHARKRVCILIAGAFFSSELLAMSMGFTCFWGASLRSRPFLLRCFEGMFFCILGIPVGLYAASAIPRCYTAFWTFLELYASILYFMLYVVAYSFELVMLIRGGDEDYVRHSIRLFIDAPAVILHFIRLVWRESLWRRMIW